MSFEHNKLKNSNPNYNSSPFHSDAYVKKKLEKFGDMGKTIVPNGKSYLLENSFIVKILEEILPLNMILRETLLADENFYPEMREECLSLSPIIVSHPKNTILRITLPPLIKTNINGSYDIYWQTKLALEEYFENHPLPILTDKKLYIIYKKYSAKLNNSFESCDNDNWESKRTTNAILESLNHSDNPHSLSHIYTAVDSSYEYVEATLIEEKDLIYFIDYLHDDTIPKCSPFEEHKRKFQNKGD